MPFLPSILPASDPYRRIREEIEGGLGNHRKARDEAAKQLDYYHGRFERYPVRPYGTSRDVAKYPRQSLVMQCAINTLTKNLYKAGPVRTLVDAPAATVWLRECYRANRLNAVWQFADRMSMAADVAAFQVVPTEDPRKPVRILLWDASEFVVWADPEDQTKPIAVAVIDGYNEQTRLRLWTDETVTTYTTKELGTDQTAGGREFRRLRERPNDLGFIPFSFVHFNMPVTTLQTGGPGRYLCDVNEGMNLILTQALDRVRFNLNPPIIAVNTPPGWAPPSSPIQPGDVWFPPMQVSAAGQSLAPPDFHYLEANTAVVDASWQDIENYLDHVLQMINVPPAVIRMIQDAARSGESIKAEQAPLVEWAEARQEPFGYYESDLACIVLKVGARHLGAQQDDPDYGAEYRATADDLERAARYVQLNLRWPKMYPRMPGEEQNREYQWLLDNGLISRTAILQKEEGMTKEESRDYLEEVAEDIRWEREIFGDVMPVPLSGEETRAQMEAEQEVADAKDKTDAGNGKPTDE